MQEAGCRTYRESPKDPRVVILSEAEATAGSCRAVEGSLSSKSTFTVSDRIGKSTASADKTNSQIGKGLAIFLLFP
jgi:hypothetical protein